MRGMKRTTSGQIFGGRVNKREAGVLTFAKQLAIVDYDFTSDGGTVSTISFNTNLPANAVVTNIYSDEITALTSGGAATLQLKCESTNLTDADAFDTEFLSAKVQDLASSATAIKVAAGGELKLAIAGAALTAGKVRFAVEFYVSEHQA